MRDTAINNALGKRARVHGTSSSTCPEGREDLYCKMLAEGSLSAGRQGKIENNPQVSFGIGLVNSFVTAVQKYAPEVASSKE